jgi:hypothetical protein
MTIALCSMALFGLFEFDLGLRQFHSDGLRRWSKKRVKRREMGKLIVIVLATLAALKRVWTELHDRWLERETSSIYR